MWEFREYDRLLVALREMVTRRSPRVIGVEGFRSAGKSHLAKCLAADMGCEMVETDDSFVKLRCPDWIMEDAAAESYVGSLCLGDLARRFDDALDRYPLVVVEGVCLRDVLAKIDRSADLFVYVECVSNDEERSLDTFDLKERSRNALDRDVLEYHARARPRERADLVRIRFA